MGFLYNRCPFPANPIWGNHTWGKWETLSYYNVRTCTSCNYTMQRS